MGCQLLRDYLQSYLECRHGDDNGLVSFVYNVATMATTECKDILIAIIISANIQKYTENKQIFIFIFFLFIVVTKKCTRIVPYTNEIISSARQVERIDKRIYASIGIKWLIQAMYVQHSYYRFYILYYYRFYYSL